jgi:hypothetical protein
MIHKGSLLKRKLPRFENAGSNNSDCSAYPLTNIGVPFR